MSVNAFKKGAKLAMAIMMMVMMISPGTLAALTVCDDWTVRGIEWKQKEENTPILEDDICNDCLSSKSTRYVMGEKAVKYERKDGKNFRTRDTTKHICGDIEITLEDKGNLDDTHFAILADGKISPLPGAIWPTNGLTTYKFTVNVKMAESETVNIQPVEFQIFGGCDSSKWDLSDPSSIYDTPENKNLIHIKNNTDANIMPFNLISQYQKSCEASFVNELTSAAADSALFIRQVSPTEDFKISVNYGVVQSTVETLTLSFRFKSDSGDPESADHLLIYQSFTVKIDLSCSFSNDNEDFGEVFTNKISTIFVQKTGSEFTKALDEQNDILFVWNPKSDAFKNCLTEVQLTSQEKYTNALEKVTVDQWKMLSREPGSYQRYIKLRSFSANAQEPAKGVYELKFTATAGFPKKTAEYTLKIIHEDECYTVPQQLELLVKPSKKIRTFDEVVYLFPYKYDFSSCNALNITSTIPSRKMTDLSIIQLPISEIVFRNINLFIKLKPLLSYSEAGDYKPPGEYYFAINFTYKGNSTQYNHTVIVQDRCSAYFLSMQLSDECLIKQAPISSYFNIRHEFDFSSSKCEISYKPQDCFPHDRDRGVLVEFDPLYNGMFAQVDGSGNEMPLDTTGNYVVGNKFSVNIQVVDPALENTKQIDFSLFYSFSSIQSQEVAYSIEVKPCLCSKWQLNNLPSEELIYLTGKDLTFKDPVCIDIAECQKGPSEWHIEFYDVTSAEALASPTSLSPDFFTNELPSTLKMKQIPIATVDTTVKVKVAYKYMQDTGEDQSRSQAEKFEVTFKPCWCSEYEIPEVTSVTHTFQEPTIEVNVSKPYCIGDAARCLVASLFKYEALQADGSALPDGMAFDAASMIFRVNQLTNPAVAKTIDVVITVDTDEVTIKPVEVKFKVKLEAALDVSIRAEPSLAITYEMSFNDTFEQLFTFQSQSEDDTLNIKARTHPFIVTEVGRADVLISVDGPAALNFTQASTNKTESVKIEVNEQIFKFTIKLLLPPSEDKNETQSESQKDVSSKFADLLITQKPNPIAKFYNFVPKTAEELAEVKISAAVQQVAKNGAISIAYEPPVATVPKEWSKYFDQAELNKLSRKEREIRQEEAKKFLHITFVQNSEENQQTHFVANLTQFTPEGIQIRLDFSDPLFVSQGDQADQVRIKLLKEFFLNAGEQRLLRDLASLSAYDDDKYLVFTADLPLLMASQEEYETLQDQVSQAKDAITAQFLGSMFLQIFLSGALSMLWNIFNTLQIILALNLLMVAFPANIKYFQEQIEDLINLEIFPTDKIYDSVLVPMFDLQTSEEKKEIAMEKARQDSENDIEPASRGLSDKFLGSSILMNVLTVLLALTVFILAIAFIFLCKYTILPRCCGCFKNLMVKLERKLFWNSLLRAFLEMYLSTSIFFFHAMGNIDTNDNEGRIEYLTWLATGCFLFAFPYVTFRILFTRWTTIHKSEVRERYDSLYQNVDVFKGPIAFSFSFYFCLRRLAFAFVIGQVYRTIVFQIYLADLTSTLMLMYFICFLPMEDRINNAIQIINEVVVLACIQSMFLFTNYVESPEVRHAMGQNVLYLVAVNVFINLVILIMIIARKIYRAIRSWYAKRLMAKAMRLRVEAAVAKASKRGFKERLGKRVTFATNPDSSNSHLKQSDMERGPPRRKPIADFINIMDRSNQISESESEESQSISYESNEFLDDLSWHSAYSDQSSPDDDSEEDKEFPSRAQILAFSDPELKSQARRIQLQYNNKENEMMAIDYPEFVLQFQTYQKFKGLGFKFCTLRRKAAIQTLKVNVKEKQAREIKTPQLLQARQEFEQQKMSSEAGSEEEKLPSIDHLTKELESIIGPEVAEIQEEEQVEVVDQKQQEAAYEEAKVHRVSLQAKRKSRYLRNLLQENEEEQEDCD